MEHSCVQLNDLPDEILTIIFQKLDNVSALYSLIYVNKRINRIARDSIFTNRLKLMATVPGRSIHQLPDPLLDRFCLQILPEIHNQIKWLDLESSSMERILRCTNYPNLHGLGLYCIDLNKAEDLFIKETVLAPVVKNQILSLTIDTPYYGKKTSINNMSTLIFTQICTMFTNLKYLNYGLSSIFFQRLSFSSSSSNISSSTLIELHVCLSGFGDCLYLLDGRFTQLRALHANIFTISSHNVTAHNQRELPNLTSFSLRVDSSTCCYDELIVPLLQRMSNLEKLDLCLVHNCNGYFIDGNNLRKDAINHLPRLNKMTFNIRSVIRDNHQIDSPSTEDIQHTFKDIKDNQVICCVDHFQEERYSQCHIYSHPYQLEFYKDITNNFPGGLFKYVTEVSLYDESPFEHEFFLRLAQSFPLMTDLTVVNWKAQNGKRCRKGKRQNANVSVIEYPSLTDLNLFDVHDDYIEQFLSHTKTSLLKNVDLFIMYKPLKRVTHNFKRETTRINCAKIRCTCLEDNIRFPIHTKDYFLKLHIDHDVGFRIFFK